MFAVPLNRPSSGVKPFVFTQNFPQQTWDIVHNLGRPVQVRLVDSNNETMLAEILELTTNQIQVRFGGPETGRAYLV